MLLTILKKKKRKTGKTYLKISAASKFPVSRGDKSEENGGREKERGKGKRKIKEPSEKRVYPGMAS